MAPRSQAPVSKTTDTWKTKIKPAKINDAVVATELRDRKLEVSGTSETKASRLERYLVENAGGHKIAECDCGGRSPVNLSRCPFCGDESPVEDLPPVVDGKKPGAIVVAPTPEDDDAKALASAQGLQPSVDEVRDLDTRVARIKEMGMKFHAAAWDLGEEIRQVHEKKLWLHRRDAAGAPVHRTFETFVQEEIGISRGTAYKHMEVAKAFTRPQVLALGISKLKLLVQLPEGAERQQLLLAAPDMSKRTLGAAVAELVGPGKPTPDDSEEEEDEDEDDVVLAPSEGSSATQAAQGSKPTTRAAAPSSSVYGGKAVAPLKPGEQIRPGGTNDPLGAIPKPQLVTVTMRPEEFQMQFFAKPLAKGRKKERRAMDLTDLPVGDHTFENGAKLRIRLRKGEKGIYAICEFLKGED